LVRQREEGAHLIPIGSSLVAVPVIPNVGEGPARARIPDSGFRVESGPLAPGHLWRDGPN